MHPRLHERLTSSYCLCSADIAIFWRDLALAFKRTRNKKLLATQQSLKDAPSMVTTMWSSLTKASLQSSSFSSPPWIELALPYILGLQNTIVDGLDRGYMATSVTSAYLTCFTTHLHHSSHFNTLPARLAPLESWLRAPEQNAWDKSIQGMLLKSYYAPYIHTGLLIAAWRGHQLHDGQSRLCCCSVPADHADFTSGNDFTEYNWAGEHLHSIVTGLLVHHVCVPSMKLVALQGDTAVAAAAVAAEGAAAAEEEAKAAFAAAVAAGAEAMAEEEHAGSGHSMPHETAELVGTSARERGPADVQVRGVHSAGRGPALAGSGPAAAPAARAGAALQPAAGGALLAAEGVGERGGSAARAVRVGEGGDGGGGGGAAAGVEEGGRVAAAGGDAEAALAERGRGAVASGGGGGGREAAAAWKEGTAGAEAMAEGKGETITTAAAAQGEGGEGGVAAAEGEQAEAAVFAGAAAVAGRSDAAAQGRTHSPADILSAGSSQREAVGEFNAGVLWLASADHAEAFGESLVGFHEEDPLGHDSVEYMELKLLLELLLVETGVTGGPSLGTATQVMFQT